MDNVLKCVTNVSPNDEHKLSANGVRVSKDFALWDIYLIPKVNDQSTFPFILHFRIN